VSAGESLTGKLDPEPALMASSLAERDEVRALAVVLTGAFVSQRAPKFMSRLAGELFIAGLALTQLYGAIMYLPDKAVLMLTPPPKMYRQLILPSVVCMVAGRGGRSLRAATAFGLSCVIQGFISSRGRADGSSWYVKNFAAWPSGTGAGSDLLSNLCVLADRKNMPLCLVASNSDNRRLYTRAGFTIVRVLRWRRGTLMIRRPFAPVALPPATRRPVFLAGLRARELIGKRAVRGGPSAQACSAVTQ
jgi:hypothetical protein